MPDELLETDVVLNAGRAGYSATGLRVPSVLRLHRLMTVATSMIQRELGSLSQDIQAEVDRKLLKLFELDKAEALTRVLETAVDDSIAAERSDGPTKPPEGGATDLDEENKEPPS